MIGAVSRMESAMRTLPMSLSAGLAVVALTACATTGGESYQVEYDRLNAQCQARGGILTPSFSPSSGRPATDYHCDIRDGGRLAADRADRD